MLLHNKYWIIVLLFNLITSITSAVASASGTYYAKWIFGNDNLVALVGTLECWLQLLDSLFPNQSLVNLGLPKLFRLDL